jgi:hypothetical protein
MIRTALNTAAILSSLTLLTACQTTSSEPSVQPAPSPTTNATPVVQGDKNSLEQVTRPTLAPCIEFASGGGINSQPLTAAGFSASKLFGKTTYRRYIGDSLLDRLSLRSVSVEFNPKSKSCHITLSPSYGYKGSILNIGAKALTERGFKLDPTTSTRRKPQFIRGGTRISLRGWEVRSSTGSSLNLTFTPAK